MSGRRTDTHRRDRESGASAVEFALLLPVLVLIIAAMIDFGFIFAQQVGLNNAARDASRAGVVQGLNGTAQQCKDVVQTARAGMGGTLGVSSTTSVGVAVDGAGANDCSAPSAGTTASTALPCAGSSTTDRVTVTLTYTPQALVPLPFLNSMVLSAKGVFKCEYS